jgi:hypothetical protein
MGHSGLFLFSKTRRFVFEIGMLLGTFAGCIAGSAFVERIVKKLDKMRAELDDEKVE